MGKVTLTHPRTRVEKQVDAAIYDPFKMAIMQSLKGSDGKSFTELTNEVEEIIHRKMPGFNGSIPWYTISVRLDLETKGLIETSTVKGKKLNRLKK